MACAVQWSKYHYHCTNYTEAFLLQISTKRNALYTLELLVILKPQSVAYVFVLFYSFLDIIQQITVILVPYFGLCSFIFHTLAYIKLWISCCSCNYKWILFEVVLICLEFENNNNMGIFFVNPWLVHSNFCCVCLCNESKQCVCNVLVYLECTLLFKHPCDGSRPTVCLVDILHYITTH